MGRERGGAGGGGAEGEIAESRQQRAVSYRVQGAGFRVQGSGTAVKDVRSLPVEEGAIILDSVSLIA
jgi:hypothetical protein